MYAHTLFSLLPADHDTNVKNSRFARLFTFRSTRFDAGKSLGNLLIYRCHKLYLLIAISYVTATLKEEVEVVE